MIKPIAHCTDEELVAIVRSTSPTGRFALERADALKEMGERVAHECISNDQAHEGAPPQVRRPMIAAITTKSGHVMRFEFADHVTAQAYVDHVLATNPMRKLTGKVEMTAGEEASAICDNQPKGPCHEQLPAKR